MNYEEIVQKAKMITTKAYIETVVHELTHTNKVEIEKIEKSTVENSTNYYVSASIKLYSTESLGVNTTIAGWYGARIHAVSMGKNWLSVGLFIDDDIRKDISTINVNIKRIDRRKRIVKGDPEV